MRSFHIGLAFFLTLDVISVRADKVDDAVQKGVKFLVSSQDKRTGAFNSPKRTRHAAVNSYPMTALAIMSMAAVGHQPTDPGEIGEAMKKGIEFLLRPDPRRHRSQGYYGVDGSRIGVGGASCGAMLTGDLPTRHSGITTLMLLSGPPSEAAIAHIAATPALGVFGAGAEDDQVIAGVANTIKGAVDGSKNPRSTAKVFPGTEHGLPMFEANAGFESELVAWLKTQLLSN